MSEKKTVPVDLLVAAKSLCDKLRRIHNDPLYQSVWLTASNHGIDYSNGIKYIDELEQLEKMIAAAPLNKQISLPKITEEILDQFEGEKFIERDLETRGPRWTQEAVDFVCLLSQQATEVSQDELTRLAFEIADEYAIWRCKTGAPGEWWNYARQPKLHRYLELRGLLERHSTNPKRVRVREDV